MRDLEHVSEIDRVLKGYETGRDGLVSESWRRCVQTYGMDPARPEPAHIVTEQQLREHQEQSERLIATARSGLRTLFKQVAGHNYVLLLADAKGRVRRLLWRSSVRGRSPAGGPLSRVRLVRGSCGNLRCRLLHRDGGSVRSTRAITSGCRIHRCPVRRPPSTTPAASWRRFWIFPSCAPQARNRARTSR